MLKFTEEKKFHAVEHLAYDKTLMARDAKQLYQQVWHFHCVFSRTIWEIAFVESSVSYSIVFVCQMGRVDSQEYADWEWKIDHLTSNGCKVHIKPIKDTIYSLKNGDRENSRLKKKSVRIQSFDMNRCLENEICINVMLQLNSLNRNR